MEREDCIETNSLRKQSLERHGNEVLGTQSGDRLGCQFVEKYKVYLGSEPLKLRVENRDIIG